MHYQYYTCDATEQMQFIAREFNCSETTFVLPAEQGHIEVD